MAMQLMRWGSYPPAPKSALSNTMVAKRKTSYCETCDRMFSSPHVLMEHYRNSPMHLYCVRCDRHFESQKHLDKHVRNSKSHFLCEACNVDYFNHSDLIDHYALSGRHSFCVLCQILFEDDDLLEEHIEGEHHVCWHCDVFYSSSKDLQEHFNRDESHPWCHLCNKGFKDDHALDVHRASAKDHFFCLMCKQDFGSANNLLRHFDSPVHMGQVIACPYCARTYQMHASLVMHMESGTCESGLINRKKLDRKIRRIDRYNVITNPHQNSSDASRSRNLLEGPPVSHEVYGGAASTNRSGNALVLRNQYQHPNQASASHVVGLSQYGNQLMATTASWNGAYFECPLCFKQFCTLSSLNTHLASSAHSNAQYKCPDTKTCGKTFKTLSALVQHVETDDCGLVRFGRWMGTTKETVENITEKFREMETCT